MNKIPTWVNWMVVDHQGNVGWFANKPTHLLFGWYAEGQQLLLHSELHKAESVIEI
jgi:hypothetical protein